MKTKTNNTLLPEPIREPKELMEEAFSAYFKHFGSDGTKPMLPNSISSTVGRKFVYIRSGNELLAKYNLKTKKIISEV